ncbi:hypothetical protein N7274_15985, partial [Enterococcus faecalis]
MTAKAVSGYLPANDATLAISVQVAGGTGVAMGASANGTAGVAGLASVSASSLIPQFCLLYTSILAR